ncbi:hypothetical protein SKAU_G00009790 [Synaphobranchus kaupii]|uniref:Uncharacterized protein n=1 Tax=Synaphobranchus kaupii TaxID=118154 RepID=A0A9Q1JB30_SYNKA|nr:hypothetical protein SKAU_G00009790 [Synaphobranchus kaupii]
MRGEPGDQVSVGAETHLPKGRLQRTSLFSNGVKARGLITGVPIPVIPKLFREGLAESPRRRPPRPGDPLTSLLAIESESLTSAALKVPSHCNDTFLGAGA